MLEERFAEISIGFMNLADRLQQDAVGYRLCFELNRAFVKFAEEAKTLIASKEK